MEKYHGRPFRDGHSGIRELRGKPARSLSGKFTADLLEELLIADGELARMIFTSFPYGGSVYEFRE